MPRFNEETLINWAKRPSDTEETKLGNAERMVRDALSEDPVLSGKSTEVFGQGSYANNTNVRLNSDIDINVGYTEGFYFDLPDGMTREDLGLGTPPQYSLHQYKEDVYSALVRKFGAASVQRKNKCITVLGNSYRVETDVVPTWNYRRYDAGGGYVLGAKLRADSGEDVVNYPIQHIENGKQKNANTYRRFKRLTRVYKKMRCRMIDDGFFVSDSITSFLLECLVWNVPNEIFVDYDTWQSRLRASIAHLYDHTKNESKCDEWGEVSELLYLFRGNRKWSKDAARTFLVDAWVYLDY